MSQSTSTSISGPVTFADNANNPWPFVAGLALLALALWFYFRKH